LSSPGSSPRSVLYRTLAVLVVIALAFSLYAFTHIGLYLTKEDPIRKADAIAVLAGTRMDRALEAADLYQSGYAPRIVITQEKPERSFAALAQRGVTLAADTDVTRDVLQRLGVPAAAIIIPDSIHDNTAQEAQTLRQLAIGNRWRTLIVVTSPYHLRRAGFATRRELEGTGIEVQMHGTRYEPAKPDRWWANREDMRWVLDEGAKLIAYELGLGA
jgi:uncharacterized SAM-binding protein YcdF (DUF218 family)